MQLTITSRNAVVTDMMRNLIQKKVSHLYDHEEGILSCRIHLEISDGNARTSIIARMAGKELFAKGTGDNIGKALDQTIARAQRQIERAARRRKDHTALPLHAVGAYAVAA